MKRYILLLLLSVLSFSSGVQAKDWDERVQIHGFVSQALVHTSGNTWFGAEDDTSWDFTELGLNASFEPVADWLLSGQLLVRNAGSMDDQGPDVNVDFAQARWRFFADDDDAWAVAAGRLKNPIGLFNQTRDVAFTRPGIFMPQVIYYDTVRNLELSGDGMGLYGQKLNAAGAWAWDLQLGQPLVDNNVEAAFLFVDDPGKLEPDGLGLSTQLRWTSLDEQWRMALSYNQTDLAFEPATGSLLGAGDMRIQLLVGSVQWQGDDMALTFEYAREPIRMRNFGALVDGEFTIESYYGQVDYYLNEKVSLMARYEEGFYSTRDRSGVATASNLNLVGYSQVEPHWFYSKIFSVGARWGVTPNFMLRAEVARHEGSFVVSNVENPITRARDKDWDVFSILASYRFH